MFFAEWPLGHQCVFSEKLFTTNSMPFTHSIHLAISTDRLTCWITFQSLFQIIQISQYRKLLPKRLVKVAFYVSEASFLKSYLLI